MAKSAAEMVAEAKARIENLTVDDAATELDASGALLVDIREPGERADGAIAGSLSVPRGLLEFKADPDSPMHDESFARDRRIILHCASGGRSALAASTLMDIGFTNVAHMDGGMKAWKESGRPVEGG